MLNWRRLLPTKWLAGPAHLKFTQHSYIHVDQHQVPVLSWGVEASGVDSLSGLLYNAAVPNISSLISEDMSKEEQYPGWAIEHTRPSSSTLRNLRTVLPAAFSMLYRSRDWGFAIPLLISAYQFRSEFPWLGESGAKGEAGLSFALRQALMTYVVPVPDNPTDSVDDSFAAMRDHWRADAALLPARPDLEAALPPLLARVVDNDFTLGQFAHALWYDGQDLSNISVPELTKHLAQAFLTYYDEREQNMSDDPL